MKKRGSRSLTWKELDAALGPRSAAHWRFHLKTLALPELDFQSNGVEFPDYLPVETLLAESLGAALGDVRACAECADVFDIDRTEGIFADIQGLDGWICVPCARKLSAHDFYRKHMATRM